MQETLTGSNLLHDSDYSLQQKVPQNILFAREIFPVSPHILAISPSGVPYLHIKKTLGEEEALIYRLD
jgi:hypothetical protein